jgi:hypothetical protein
MRYMRIITGFLLEQRAKDYDKLAGGRALDKTAMCGQLQHSITACLYFIPPHRTKKIDLILMAAISQLVTIIPVIGKSDSMTESELAAYRAEVLQMLGTPNKYVSARNLQQLEVSLFSFAESVLTDLGMSKSQLPIAVVTSRDNEPCDDPAFLESLGLSDVQNPVQPVRHYRWGACYPLNRGHSDLIVLKRLLLGDRVESLYAMLDDSYARYMTFCNAFEEAGKQLQMVVQDACQVRGILGPFYLCRVMRLLCAACFTSYSRQGSISQMSVLLMPFECLLLLAGGCLRRILIDSTADW